MTQEYSKEEVGVSAEKKADVKGLVVQLEMMLDEYMVKKAPFALPKEVKEFIVNVAPYLVIVFAILALPMIFAAIGISTALAPFAMMGGLAGGYGFGWGFSAIISLVVAVIVLVMELMAVPGMFKRSKKAWKMLFYASIVSLIGSVLSISGLVGGIIGAIIGWYILFQVKELYKN
ncbi:MAG: hypothetical protein HGA61_02735 [Candidatus Moranbacteria bacterium]|nr:hypothetical protein [Candidatus Moranbacteria bacterium]